MNTAAIEVEAIAQDDDEDKKAARRQRRNEQQRVRRAKAKGTATAKVEAVAASELQKPLSRLLGLASVVFAWYATRPIRDENKREQVQDVMEMTAQERQDISGPLANLFSRTSLAGRIGRYIIESDDYVALGTALFSYGSRVFDALKEIGEMSNVTRPEAGPPVGANGHKPAGIQFEPAASYNGLQAA